MEGNYLFKEWCKKYGHPDSYEKLRKQNPTLNQDELDTKWEQICYNYETDSFSKRGSLSNSNVITPESFGGHLKKGR